MGLADLVKGIGPCLQVLATRALVCTLAVSVALAALGLPVTGMALGPGVLRKAWWIHATCWWLADRSKVSMLPLWLHIP